MTENQREAIIIRDVTDDDIPLICQIYADEVRHGVSSWEEVPPTTEEMTARLNSILAGGHPYRVAEKDGRVVGYAYASTYRPRVGYRFTVENSIYIAETARGLGVGRQLMEDLVRHCELKGFRQMIAVIGDSENHMSRQFHKRMGFTESGVIKSIGYKFDRWMDSVIMQRFLGDGDQSPPCSEDTPD